MDNTIMRLMLFLICITLTNCKHKLTYDYLIEHPILLEKEAILCQTNPQSQCKIIMSAMNELIVMNEIQFVHPQKFGEIVMKTQFDIVQLQQKLSEMKAEQSIDAQALKQVEKDYHSLELRLKLLMAVLSRARLE